MTQLDEKKHKEQMDDMRSFAEPMPSVGIFWYDPKTTPSSEFARRN